MRLLLAMGFPRQEYWSSCCFLLQGIFLTQGSNSHLLLGRQILYQGNQLSHSKITGSKALWEPAERSSRIRTTQISSGLSETVLVSLGCYDKITRTGSLLNNRNLCLTVLKAGEFKIIAPADSVSGEGPFLGLQASCCVPLWSRGFFHRGINLIHEGSALSFQSPSQSCTS